MKAAIYGRISTDKQSELSIEAQFERCQSYCETQNWDVYGYYADIGISGTDAKSRPELMRLLSDARKGKIQVVVAHKVDRAFRNMRDYENVKYELEKLNVIMAFAESGINDGIQGDFINGLMALMAQQYSANLSREVKKTISKNVEHGNFMGGTPPLGYKIIDKKFTLDPVNSKVVRQIFDMYTNKNKSMREIASELNNNGYRTMFGREFKHTSIHTILKNQKYIGIYEHGEAKVTGVIPPIIDRETWERTREKMKSNKRLGKAKSINKRFYLLSGLITCGECGRAYVGQPSRNTRGYETVYYRCNNCKNKPIRQDWIEAKTIEAITKMCSNVDVQKLVDDTNAISEKLNKENKKKYDVFTKDLKTLRIKENNIVDAIAETGINEKLKNKLFDVQSKIEILQDQIDNLTNYDEFMPYDIELITGALELAIFQIKNGTNEVKKEAVDAIVDSVEVYKDKVIIKIKASLDSTRFDVPASVAGTLVAEVRSRHLAAIVIPFVFERI